MSGMPVSFLVVQDSSELQIFKLSPSHRVWAVVRCSLVFSEKRNQFGRRRDSDHGGIFSFPKLRI